MLHRMPSHRRSVRRAQQGQVMVFFALILPVLVAFVALSLAASISLNTKAALDQASLTAAIAASGDSCMSSPYAFDLYECTSGGAYPATLDGGIGQLPQPPFINPPFTASGTVCRNPAGVLVASCVVQERAVAEASASQEIRKILTADYPGFTITQCGNPVPACPPGTPVPNNKTIVFSAAVSYWYYFDTDDVPASGTFSTSDTPPPNMVASPGSWDVNPGLDVASGGIAAPDAPGSGDQDAINASGVPVGGSPSKSSDLVCPSTGAFGREIQVQLWTQFNNPFGGVLGIGKLGLSSSAHSFGCGGGK
jgi:hypothetical protein